MVNVLLAAMLVIPLVVVFLLKSNAALAFMSLATSSVVLTYCGDALDRLVRRFHLVGSIDKYNLYLFILVFPFAITLLLSRKTFSGHHKFAMSAIPAVCAGGLLAILVVPQLTGSIHEQISVSGNWIKLQNYQALIVGVGSLTSILLLWSSLLKPQHSSSKKKKKS